jgi:hypothetical protein
MVNLTNGPGGRNMDSDAFDDLIEQWHNGAGEGMQLHEWLGMTWPEYQAYMHTSAIPHQP